MIRFDADEFFLNAIGVVFEKTELGKLLYEILPCEILNHITQNDVWIAGGALRRMLVGQSIYDGDIDLFFPNKECFENIEQLLKSKGFVPSTQSKFQNTLQKTFNDNIVNIQLVNFEYHPSIEATINRFDFTVCQIAYDGSDIIVSPRALYDIPAKRIIINNISYPTLALRRFIKYSNQDFFVPENTLKEMLKIVIENRNGCNSNIELDPEY